MLNILSDTKKSIVETMTIRMLPNEALQYLHDCGRKISKRSYLRLKAKLEAMNFQRLMHTTKWFTDQHLQRIDKLELVGYLMWINYDAEQSPYKRVGSFFMLVTFEVCQKAFKRFK